MKSVKWITGEYDREIAELLARELSLPSLTAKLLAVRGICSSEEASAFTRKDISELYDPFLLKDMDKACQRIGKAIKNKEKIAVYGDYDADGVTATYVVLHYLKSVGADCIYYIPDRFGDGYGVSETALSAISEQGVSLIITVDTGITAISEASYAAALGIDLIITDHHKCGESLPEAYAVVNPDRADCTYPFSGLAGVGVAFKLVSALCGSDEKIIKKYLPYVCIGTIADVMPITDENRIIVANGLDVLSQYKETGLSALLDEAGAKREEPLTAGAVGFLVGPRMNAAGRMGSASLALELLFADENTAPQLAAELGGKNRERQKCEADIMKEALAVLEEHPEYKEGSAVVIDGERWHHGVLGIVASRLCTALGKPTILISVDEKDCRGSGRSVEGVSLHAAVGECADILEKFGGHDLAVGIAIKKENISDFRRRLNEALQDEMESYSPVLHIDFEVSPGELTLSQLRALRALEPYGKCNEAPKLRLNRCRVLSASPIGKNRHAKLVLEHTERFSCVYFGKAVSELPFETDDFIDVVFTPEINNFFGESVQLHIKDARPCENVLEQLFDAERYIDEENEDKTENAVFVSYDELGRVWRVLAKEETPYTLPITALLRRVRKMLSAITPAKLFIALQIFSEVGLLSFGIENYRVTICIAEHNNKVNLENSKTYNIFKSCGSR